MNQLTTRPQQMFSPEHMQIIRKQCAPQATPAEFDFFIATANFLGLNPLRKQIMLQVFNAWSRDESKRSTAIIIEIGGLRAIASRSGDYLPDNKKPRYVIDESIKGPLNPEGIVSCEVSVHKVFPNVGPFEIIGEVRWDEFAKIVDEKVWKDDAFNGKGGYIKTGNKALAETWAKMPFHMIAKVAEAHALRKGWPEQTSGLYEVAEADNWDYDEEGNVTPATATQVLEQAETQRMEARLGVTKGEFMMSFTEGDPLEAVPFGQFHDLCVAKCETIESVIELKGFRHRNQLSIQRYFAKSKSDGLALVRYFEDREKRIIEAAEAEDAQVTENKELLV